MVELVIVSVLAGWLLVRWRRSGQTYFDFVCLPLSRGYARLWHGWSCQGEAVLPKTGPVILVSNHTCSADAMFLQSAFPRIPCYLAAQAHYDSHPFIRWVLDSMDCVRVARNGRDTLAALLALRRLRQGRIVCIFPEGNLSGVAKKRLRKGKHGAALLALRTRTPVYPAYIHGGPRTDQLLLSWVWPPAGRVRVFFGPPVDLSAYHGRPPTRQVLEEVTHLLMRHVEALKPKRRRTS
ncbi:MAG: 1-acyl-sn-glycerol-3-phosphate acyltransferase [Gemmataceae bacterium]|nr:1-acyl-sn-glycerol-3-phosphate acyltransferase [Gemmataceae bacterium]